MAQVSFLTSQDEKMRWVFQLLDLDETGLVNIRASNSEKIYILGNLHNFFVFPKQIGRDFNTINNKRTNLINFKLVLMLDKGWCLMLGEG